MNRFSPSAQYSIVSTPISVSPKQHYLTFASPPEIQNMPQAVSHPDETEPLIASALPDLNLVLDLLWECCLQTVCISHSFCLASGTETLPPQIPPTSTVCQAPNSPIEVKGPLLQEAASDFSMQKQGTTPHHPPTPGQSAFISYPPQPLCRWLAATCKCL